jgi:vancomycin resistance protein YoaR
MSYGTSRGRNHRRHRSSADAPKKAVIVLGGVLIIAGAVFGVSKFFGSSEKGQESAVESEGQTTEPEEELKESVSVDGIDITGMLRSEAEEALTKKYDWDMKVSCPDLSTEEYALADLLAGSIDKVLDEVYDGTPKDSYTITWTVDDSLLQSELDAISELWGKKAVNAGISGVDDNGKWTFAGGEEGITIDTAKLSNDIQSACGSNDFDAVIEASYSKVTPEINLSNAQSVYKVMGEFTTKTTSNSNRNNNINLAAKAVSGTVLQVGEQFSFNTTTGNRTTERGYMAAGAYQNGVLVQEPGGGVCQMSSTLYNALIKTGLSADERHPHTYEPSYVTPGEDAMVSYDGYAGPDFKFTNTTTSSLMILAEYHDQTVTAKIIGIPVLAEGETVSLSSVKDETYKPGIPAPKYTEDQSLYPGTQIVTTKGDEGSRWKTNIIHKKDGTVISDEALYTSTYKGHTPAITRNSTNVWYPAGSTTPETVDAAYVQAILADRTIRESASGTYDTETLPTETTAETTAAPVESISGPAGGPGAGSSGGSGTSAGTSAAAPGSTTAASGSSESAAAPGSTSGSTSSSQTTQSTHTSPGGQTETTSGPNRTATETTGAVSPGSSSTSETIATFPGM